MGGFRAYLSEAHSMRACRAQNRRKHPSWGYEMPSQTTGAWIDAPPALRPIMSHARPVQRTARNRRVSSNRCNDLVQSCEAGYRMSGLGFSWTL